MSQPQQGGGKSVGIGTGLLLMFGMGALFLSALWFVRHDMVVRVFLLYAYALVYVPAWLCQQIGWSSGPPMELISEIAQHSYHPGRVDPGILFSVINRASVYLLPFTLIVVAMAWQVHCHVLRNMETMHDYWGLMKIQSLTNPCIMPVVRFTEYWREKGIDRHSNLFRALAPDEFAKKHDLLKKTGMNDVVIDHEKSIAVFEAQLGGLVSDGNFSDHYKALACIFMTRIVYRGAEGRKKAKAMQDAINLSCDPNKTGNKADADCSVAFDLKSVGVDFDTLYAHPLIAPHRSFFVYKKTFLMRLLNEARSDGKLPPSEFIWLKLVDRDLWYALYGVSKKLIAKGYSEGSAAFAQYWSSIAAMQHDQYLFEPHMDEAVRALEKRLFEANMISERQHMTQRELERELTFGQIPEI